MVGCAGMQTSTVITPTVHCYPINSVCTSGLHPTPQSQARERHTGNFPCYTPWFGGVDNVDTVTGRLTWPVEHQFDFFSVLNYKL